MRVKEGLRDVSGRGFGGDDDDDFDAFILEIGIFLFLYFGRWSWWVLGAEVACHPT